MQKQFVWEDLIYDLNPILTKFKNQIEEKMKIQ